MPRPVVIFPLSYRRACTDVIRCLQPSSLHLYDGCDKNSSKSLKNENEKIEGILDISHHVLFVISREEIAGIS